VRFRRRLHALLVALAIGLPASLPFGSAPPPCNLCSPPPASSIAGLPSPAGAVEALGGRAVRLRVGRLERLDVVAALDRSQRSLVVVDSRRPPVQPAVGRPRRGAARASAVRGPPFRDPVLAS